VENSVLHSRPFIHTDWLLTTDASRELYHSHASKFPIIDCLNHLPPAQIASNHQFPDLFEIWLAGDHYKWRAMRSNGFTERFCTGDAGGHEKFDAFVATFPDTLRNPPYHWSHLELARHFDLDVMISPETGNQIWEVCNAKLPSLRVNNLLEMFDVAVLGTTDDTANSLATHERIASSGIRARVHPTFRPDRASGVCTPDAFNPWLERLSSAAGMVVTTFDDLVEAPKKAT